MLSMVKTFQQQHNNANKPIIVADAAMLSQANRTALEEEGYQYIVGARLANTKASLIRSITNDLPKEEGASLRLCCSDAGYDIGCTYSRARYKQDKRELGKQQIF